MNELGWAILVTAALGVCGCSSSPKADPMAVQRGNDAFHDRVLTGLGGNGRACSDCHMDSDSFQLSPADVEARFQAASTTGVDDPLFRPIDADDFDTLGASASDYSNLRQNGLIRIRMLLPANIKLVDPSSCSTDGVAAPCDVSTTYALLPATTTDVWRSVPSVFNVKLTGHDPQTRVWPRGPNPQGGYQFDGRVDTLQNQALGAFQNHAQVTTDPDAATVDDVAAYEETLLAAPEPALDDLETQGKVIFNRACGSCHNGPGMARPNPVPDGTELFGLADVQTTCPPAADTASPPRWSFDPCPPALAKNERTYEISFAGGYKMRRTTSDPGRALLTGFVVSAYLEPDDPACLHRPCGPAFTDDWQKFEVSPLHGISKTAPYFHNNSAATLEDVVKHYEELYKKLLANDPPSPLPTILSTDGVHADRPNVESERAALVAYLMKL